MIVLLVMTTVGLEAQVHHPIVEEGKRWSVLFTIHPTLPHSTTIYQCMGDTILDHANYKKLYSTNHKNMTSWQLCGVLRENKDGQVFYREYHHFQHSFVENEQLLYDFSMNAGDSICAWNPSDYLVVTNVCDTVLETDGSSRKKFHLEYHEDGVAWEYSETWIEGIGSELGLLNRGSLFLVGGLYELLCYEENDYLIWKNPNYSLCFYGVEGLEEDEREQTIYPNPTKDKIVYEGQKVAEVQIHNALGQLVKTVQNTNEVSLEDLPPGLYLLRVTMENGAMFSDKVVKK